MCFYNKSIVDLPGAWGILCYSLSNHLARYLGPNQIFHKLGEDESSALGFFFFFFKVESSIKCISSKDYKDNFHVSHKHR